MAKPFKFRYANELAGGFVLLTLLVVVALLMLSGRLRGLVSGSTRITLILPEYGSLGLREGADVQILGASAGTVRDIIVPEDGPMQAVVDVRQQFARFVREDSVVNIRKAAVIGDTYVEIGKGKGNPLPDGAVLNVADNSDAGPDKLIAELRGEVMPTIVKVREAAEEYTLLARELRNPDGNLQQAVARFNRIAEQAEKGNGLVARLLNDKELADALSAAGPKLTVALDEITIVLRSLTKTAAALPEIATSVQEQMKRVPALIEQTQATITEVQAVMKDLQKTTNQMPEMVKSINRTVEGLPSLLVQTQETLRQVQRLVEGIQRSWLVNPYMDKGNAGEGRISPDRVGGGR